jgi:hypothetical protein
MLVRSGSSGYGWLAFKDDHAVGEIGCHNEIVLDDEGSLLCMKDESAVDIFRE